MSKMLLASAAWAALAAAAAAQDLTVWGLPAFNEAGDAYMAEMAEAFGAEAGIGVEYVVVPANILNERLAAAFEGGAAPDVFMQVGQQSQFYISRDLVMPLNEILAEMRAVEGGLYEGVVGQGMVGEDAYALPLEVDVVPLYARTDLLEEVGLEIPQTWEELRAASQAILEADPTIAPFGMPISPANDAEAMIRAVVWSFGGAMFDEAGAVTWDSPETVAAYRFLAEMFAEGTIPRSVLSWDDGSNNTAYQTGRTAFTMNPPSIYQWMDENDPDLLANTALIAVPTGPGEAGMSASPVSSFNWFVSASTDQPEAAMAWLSHFYDPANYEGLIDAVGGRWLPIYPSLTASMPLFADTPAFANFDEMARTGVVDGWRGAPTALSAEVFAAKVVSTSAQRMLVSGDSPEEAVAWAQAEIEAMAAAQTE